MNEECRERVLLTLFFFCGDGRNEVDLLILCMMAGGIVKKDEGRAKGFGKLD